MPPSPNNGLDGLISDPQFHALKPEDQRRALSGVSGDDAFTKLNDEQTSRYILQHHTILQSKERLKSIITKAQEPGQRQPDEVPNPLTRISEITTGLPHSIDALTQRDIPKAVNRPGEFAADVGRSTYEGPAALARGLMTHPIDLYNSVTGTPQFREDVHAGRYGSALADLGAGAFNDYLIAESAKGAPAAAETAAKGIATGKAAVFGPMVRRMAKAGDYELGEAATETAKANAQATTEHASKVADVQQQNRQSLASSRQTSQEKVASVERENAQIKEDYDTSVARVKADNQTLRDAVTAGVESKKASQAAAPVVAEGLDELERSETAKARAAYPKVDGTIERGQINDALQKVVDQKLRGAGRVPSSIGRILDETAPTRGRATGPTIMGRTLDLSNPSDLAAFQRFKAKGMFTPAEIERMEGSSEQLSFDDLHGMYSEMGREMQSGDLPGDSKAALSAGRDVVRDQMTKMTTAENKTAQFQAAQHGWRVLENTFRNTDPTVAGGSPLARALRTRDPVTGQLRPDYVWNILNEDKAYRVAQDLLGRYGAKDLQATLQMMKEQADAAKSAPKATALGRAKAIPPPPKLKPMPTSSAVNVKELPTAPNVAPLDPHEWVDTQLKKYASGGQGVPYASTRGIARSAINTFLRSMAKDPVFRAKVAGRARLPKGLTPPP